MKFFTLLLFVTAWVWCSTEAHAQSNPERFIGERVRVSTIMEPRVWHDGVVQSTSVTHLTLRPMDSTASVESYSIADLEGLQVHLGRSRRVKEGFVAGLATGVLLGGLLVALDVADSQSDVSNAISVIVGTIAISTGTGIVIGAMVVRDDWRKLPPSQLRLGSRGGSPAVYAALQMHLP